MVAALVRLLHSGPQDMRLLPKKGPTDVSAYIRVLTRTGRFTTQWSRLDFQQKPQFGQQAVCRLLKKGELITRLYLVATLPDIYTPQAAAIAAADGEVNFAGPRFGWTNSIGHALIQSATVDIGGARVETLDSRLLEIHDEYDTPLEKVVNKNALIGRLQNGFTETSLGNSVQPTRVIVPLPFWFCRGDLGAALPIDAIHVDEVRVSIQFRGINGCYYTDSRVDSDSIIPTVEGSALWPMAGSDFYRILPPPPPVQEGDKLPGIIYKDKTAVSKKVRIIPGIQMPQTFSLGDTYLLAEYIYLDKPEANRFRLGDIQIPMTQHYRIEPHDTQRFRDVTIPLEISNPTRHLFFMAQNYNAVAYNTYFLATRNLASQYRYKVPLSASERSETFEPWWPDCSGLNAATAGFLVPGFSTRGSEPFASIELLYEGNFVKTSTENCSLYRSILPSIDERKSPWINRYMYCIPFGVQQGYFGPSMPLGQVNMGRIMKKELRFGIAGQGGTPERLWIHVWAETYNILRIFGGRAGLLFGY